MKVGDVYLDPDKARVRVVFTVEGDYCLMALLSIAELEDWIRMPESEHDFHTIELEKHPCARIERCARADTRVMNMARRYVFADPAVGILPVTVLA